MSVNVWLPCWNSKLQYFSGVHCQFIQGHWRKLIIRNRSGWPILFLLNVFTALKGTHLNIFIRDMQFNPSKCQVLHITRKVKPFNIKYILHKVEMESVSAAKYLGSPSLMTSHGLDTLIILQRKPIKPLDFLKETYGSIIRPLHQLFIKLLSGHSYHDKDINKVEAVQRRAARWATRDYRYTSSVTATLKDLNWRPLDQRRIDCRLLMMYKVTYDIVAIPAPEYLVRNTRQSRHIHSLAYRQIDPYTQRGYHPLERPPCLYTSSSYPGSV